MEEKDASLHQAILQSSATQQVGPWCMYKEKGARIYSWWDPEKQEWAENDRCMNPIEVRCSTCNTCICKEHKHWEKDICWHCYLKLKRKGS